MITDQQIHVCWSATIYEEFLIQNNIDENDED